MILRDAGQRARPAHAHLLDRRERDRDGGPRLVTARRRRQSSRRSPTPRRPRGSSPVGAARWSSVSVGSSVFVTPAPRLPPLSATRSPSSASTSPAAGSGAAGRSSRTRACRPWTRRRARCCVRSASSPSRWRRRRPPAARRSRACARRSPTRSSRELARRRRDRGGDLSTLEGRLHPLAVLVLARRRYVGAGLLPCSVIVISAGTRVIALLALGLLLAVGSACSPGRASATASPTAGSSCTRASSPLRAHDPARAGAGRRRDARRSCTGCSGSCASRSRRRRAAATRRSSPCPLCRPRRPRRCGPPCWARLRLLRPTRRSPPSGRSIARSAARLALGGVTSLSYLLAPAAVVGVALNLADDLPAELVERAGESVVDLAPHRRRRGRRRRRRGASRSSSSSPLRARCSSTGTSHSRTTASA